MRMCHWNNQWETNATTLLEELEAPSSCGARTESSCKAKQREASFLGGFNLMAMEGKHSEDKEDSTATASAGWNKAEDMSEPGMLRAQSWYLHLLKL